MFQGKVLVIYNQEILPCINMMWVQAPEISAKSTPGQFVMISCDNDHDRILRRPISINHVLGNTLGFLFAVVGEGTYWLANRQEEQIIDILGPMGNHFSLNPESHNVLLVAGGIGIAPLNYLANEAVKTGCKVRILVGAKSKDYILPDTFLPPNCELVYVTEDGSKGEEGLVTTVLPEHSAWADQVFACGPLSMYKAIAADKEILLNRKPTQVSLEVRMGCGLGFCYGCTINTHNGPRQVCKDGPVFNIDDIIWDELI